MSDPTYQEKAQDGSSTTPSDAVVKRDKFEANKIGCHVRHMEMVRTLAIIYNIRDHYPLVTIVLLVICLNDTKSLAFDGIQYYLMVSIIMYLLNLVIQCMIFNAVMLTLFCNCFCLAQVCASAAFLARQDTYTHLICTYAFVDVCLGFSSWLIISIGPPSVSLHATLYKFYSQQIGQNSLATD